MERSIPIQFLQPLKKLGRAALLAKVILTTGCTDRDSYSSSDRDSTGISGDSAATEILSECQTAEEKCNLLIISVDTLNRKAAEASMTYFAELANQGTSARNVLTEPWTLPALAEVLTGKNVLDHEKNILKNFGINQDTPTLPGILRDRGGYTSYLDSANTGVLGQDEAQGSTHLTKDFDKVETATESGQQIERGALWAKAQTEPWVTQIHFNDPHSPWNLYDTSCQDPATAAVAACYSESSAVGQGFDLSREVDHEDIERASVNWPVNVWETCTNAAPLAYTCEGIRLDENIKKAIEKFEELELLNHTLIITMNDHGEAFGGRNQDNPTWMHPSSPFLEGQGGFLSFSGPGIENKTIEEPVDQIDVLPTVCTLLNIDCSDLELKGSPIWQIDSERVVVSDLCLGHGGYVTGVMTNKVHAFEGQTERGQQLGMYDLADREEEQNLAANEEDLPLEISAVIAQRKEEVADYNLCP